MKKLIAMIVIICILPTWAFALDLSQFNAGAYVCGEKNLLNESDGIKADPYIVFKSEGCLIGFKEENDKITQIVVQGDGTHFIAYSMAAILVFVGSYNNFAENAGSLLSCFLLARNGEGQITYTSTGESIFIRPHNDEFYFSVGK